MGNMMGWMTVSLYILSQKIVIAMRRRRGFQHHGVSSKQRMFEAGQAGFLLVVDVCGRKGLF